MKERRLARVQDKGQVTLPAPIRKRLGLKKGDVVAIVETRDGVLVTPQELLTTRTLDRLGEILRDEGYSLEELIESGREERGTLITHLYGNHPDRSAD